MGGIYHFTVISITDSLFLKNAVVSLWWVSKSQQQKLLPLCTGGEGMLLHTSIYKVRCG